MRFGGSRGARFGVVVRAQGLVAPGERRALSGLGSQIVRWRRRSPRRPW